MKTHSHQIRAAALGALGILSLLTTTAHAEPPESSDSHAIIGAMDSPALALPTLTSVSTAPPLDSTKRWKWRSPALVAVGTGGIVVGVPTMLLGGLVMALAAGPFSEGGSAAGGIAVGGLIALTGGSFVAGGIVGIVYGSAPVPARKEHASVVPSLSIGSRSGSLTWRF
jgi:hypothetical protein